MSYGDLPEILRTVAQVIDSREEPRGALSLEHRRLTTIQRLLAGDSLDGGLLNYNFDGFHAGVVVAGPHPTAALEGLRGKQSCRLLLVQVDDRTAWAWLGGGRRPVAADLHSLGSLEWAEHAVSCGQPSEGIEGWRLTHRQAAAALPVAQSKPAAPVHYPDVALLAAALQDDLLSSSLRQAYLAPLEDDRDRGQAAKDTLRAYFKAERNASSAAALLGVNRATVRNRLTAIEDRLGRSPDAISAELEVALRLDELTSEAIPQQDVATC